MAGGRDKAKRIRWFVPLVGLLFLVAGVSYGTLDEGANAMDTGKELSTKVDRVDPDDLAALRNWATGICRGRTIDEVAAPLGIQATMDSVIEYLTRGLPEKSERTVKVICERELSA